MAENNRTFAFGPEIVAFQGGLSVSGMLSVPLLAMFLKSQDLLWFGGAWVAEAALAILWIAFLVLAGYVRRLNVRAPGVDIAFEIGIPHSGLSAEPVNSGDI